MAELILDAVDKRFGAVHAVKELSLTVADGEFLVLLGPTGTGKTTTLRIAAGLERPERGRVMIGGIDRTKAQPAERDVAFVFQQYSLYPHLSVYDNMAFPLRAPARRLPEAEVDRAVRQAAALLRIDDKLSNKATALSGGQMQRVAIGRALVRRPALYLMDEPLSSLDAKLRADLRLELKRIQEELGATILYVTHDQIEAMTLASRIGVMRDGALIQVGTPREIYEAPVNAYVATRLGSPAVNLVPRRLVPNIAAPPTAETIGARTEHVRIRRAEKAGAIGQVTWIEHLGDQNHLHIQLENQDLVTLSDPDSGLTVGDSVAVDFVGALYFDREGNRVAG